MSASSIPLIDVERAKEIWAAYRRQHDVSKRNNQTAGIEPISERIWFGESAADVHKKMVADGVERPAYFVRVGYGYYLRK